MTKRCGHCGRAFFCQEASGCWCGEVKLAPAQLAWIKEAFDNCLCAECLKAVAASSLAPGRPGGTVA